MKTLLRILIVEDSEDDALLVIHQIKKGGYNIEYERVETAEEMKAALEGNTWDIILSDYKMPHFNGLEALTILQEFGIDIPFIVISGTIGEEVAVEAMKAGAHDYLMKNNLKRLLPAIERELRESNIRAEQKLLELKQKQAEEDRIAHTRFIENMDLINQAILRSGDIEQMMSNVLEMTLTIFDCDRSWLFYPCDPEATFFRVPMEITKPEYPGAKSLNVDVPMSSEMAQNLREALESDDPVIYTSGTEKPVNNISAEQFGVQSQMFIPLYPKTGKPWVFGVHQCSYPRIWTLEEKRLFMEIGRRLSDALTSLLMYRDLCKSEAENRAIVDTIPDLMFRVDKDGIIMDFRKPENMELYVSPDQFLGKSIKEVLPANVSKAATPAIAKALKTNEIVTFEYDLLVKGQTIYYEGRMIAFSKNEVLILVRNITERKHAEQEIARVNRALRILSESNQALIHITDEGMLLNEVCKIVVEVGGYRMAWVGFAEHDEEKTLRPAAHAGFGSGYIESAKATWADNERGRGPVGTAIRKGQPCIVHNISSDPSFAPWLKAAMQHGYQSIIALPLKSEGETLGALGIYSGETDAFDVKEVEILKELADDLTFGITALRTRAKREMAEIALGESEERFRTLYENAKIGLYRTTPDGKILLSNKTLVKLLGYESFEKLAERNLEKDGFEPSYQRKDFIEMIEKDGEVNDFESAWVRHDGSVFFVRESAQAIRDSHGVTMYYDGVIEDITMRRLAEIELIKAKEKAEESDRLKSAFLASISHEIRTPMNGILGFADLLKEPNLTGEEQKRYISIIGKSGTRMLNIINELVDISKIASGQMGISIFKTNINEQVEFIYTFFKPEAIQKGIGFSYKNALPDKAAIINTDHEKLNAILTNLVKNAIKYTSQGSIEFGYNVVETMHASSQLTFFVKDTGIGIPKERQEAIFDRFVQADISDKNALQGAGLGLSISKAYVEMLGGKIWLESKEGTQPGGTTGGSIFYFTIPYNAEPEVSFASNNVVLPDDEESRIYPNISALKVLIAEDDETSKDLIAEAIQKLSKEVLIVKNGVEAVEICRKNPDIDLILMDLKIPEMNGYEAARQIRNFNKDVIIIAQTAYALIGDREKAIEAGCNNYISKPIRKNELIELIQKHFKK